MIYHPLRSKIRFGRENHVLKDQGFRTLVQGRAHNLYGSA